MGLELRFLEKVYRFRGHRPRGHPGAGDYISFLSIFNSPLLAGRKSAKKPPTASGLGLTAPTGRRRRRGKETLALAVHLRLISTP